MVTNREDIPSNRENLGDPVLDCASSARLGWRAGRLAAQGTGLGCRLAAATIPAKARNS